jgi:hypothetical protein
MLEYGLRFLAGGIAVSAFAALGDTLRPKASRACSALLPRLPSQRFLSPCRKRARRSRPLKAAQ